MLVWPWLRSLDPKKTENPRPPPIRLDFGRSYDKPSPSSLQSLLRQIAEVLLSPFALPRHPSRPAVLNAGLCSDGLDDRLGRFRLHLASLVQHLKCKRKQEVRQDNGYFLRISRGIDGVFSRGPKAFKAVRREFKAVFSEPAIFCTECLLLCKASHVQTGKGRWRQDNEGLKRFKPRFQRVFYGRFVSIQGANRHCFGQSQGCVTIEKKLQETSRYANGAFLKYP